MRSSAGVWLRPATGEYIAHPAMMATVARADVVLVGENHDRADHHRWQLSVLAGLLAHRADIVVGFEMFPARADPVLSDWVAGRLSPAAFLGAVEWEQVWRFAADLYLPLFHFCRLHHLPMVGLNCARELVRRVGAEGWDAIPEAEREGLTPAAPATADYRRYLFEVTGGRREGRAAQDPMDPAFDRFVRAQQTWDRAFACRIVATRRTVAPGPIIRGDLDSRDREGTASSLVESSGFIRSEKLDPSPSPPLVVGIIGRGHLEFRGGVPHQLDDLGLPGAVVLLPVQAGNEVPAGVADAVFGIGAMTG